MKNLIIFSIFAMGFISNMEAASTIGAHNYRSLEQQKVDLMKEQNALIKENIQQQRRESESRSFKEMDGYLDNMRNKFKY